MFAILDRTNLLMQQTADPEATRLDATIGNLQPALPSATVTTTSQQVQAGTDRVVRVGAMSGRTVVTTSPPTPPLTWHMDWAIRGTPATPPGQPVIRGSVLLIEGGTANEEVVVVSQVNVTASTFRATFKKDHASGANVAVLYQPGNPGPQPRFDYRSNTAVVPYMSIIK